MKPEVRRLHRSLETSPASVSEMPGARVTLVCEKCCVPRDLDLSTPRLRRYWTQDFEVIFSLVAFRCRCGKHASAMRIMRPTRDSHEVLLTVTTRGEYHG